MKEQRKASKAVRGRGCATAWARFNHARMLPTVAGAPRTEARGEYGCACPRFCLRWRCAEPPSPLPPQAATSSAAAGAAQAEAEAAAVSSRAPALAVGCSDTPRLRGVQVDERGRMAAMRERADAGIAEMDESDKFLKVCWGVASRSSGCVCGGIVVVGACVRRRASTGPKRSWRR